MKKLSKKDRIIVTIASIVLAIALSCQGWYYWPWFGGNVVRVQPYEWEKFETSSSPESKIPAIQNHSSYSKRRLVKLFRDIVIRMEYNHTVHTCRKWNTPISLYIGGDPSSEDLTVLQDACDFLNSIQGFPGITTVSSEEEANITILFTEEIMKGMNGCFEIISQDNSGNISEILIRIRNSLSREKKNSVIWEELLQSTGPMNDTLLTDDTLFYGGQGDIPRASELDRTLLEMLYHPLVKSDMNYLQCLSIFWLYLR